MSSPTSRAVLVLAVLLSSPALAGEGDPCWECRAAACYGTFKDTADRAWRETDAEAMARWDEISARVADLEAANAEHESVVAELERSRDASVEAAYLKMFACLDPGS